MKTLPEYIAGGDAEYLYPAAGDPLPAAGARVIVLTIGGTCSIGPFKPGEDKGWHPLISRNHEKEKLL